MRSRAQLRRPDLASCTGLVSRTVPSRGGRRRAWARRRPGSPSGRDAFPEGRAKNSAAASQGRVPGRTFTFHQRIAVVKRVLPAASGEARRGRASRPGLGRHGLHTISHWESKSCSSLLWSCSCSCSCSSSALLPPAEPKRGIEQEHEHEGADVDNDATPGQVWHHSLAICAQG